LAEEVDEAKKYNFINDAVPLFSSRQVQLPESWSREEKTLPVT
jgi:hypothetical protein